RQHVPWAVIPSGRRALSHMSANFYRQPAEKLKVIGITGTNGKTTTTFLCESILRHCARPSALIGTIEYHVPQKANAAQAAADLQYRVLPSPHTTPEALELNQVFAQALDAGATHAVMEVSSHALAQERVWGIPFEVAVFTNLTRDHLDFHGDMQTYSAAKQMLFEGVGTAPPKFAAINTDDDFGRKLAELSRKKGSSVITYGVNHPADLLAESIQLSPQGTAFTLRTTDGKHQIQSPLIGKVNVYNLLAAIGAAQAL